MLAAHDPVGGALINRTIRQTSPWTALVNNWGHMRAPLSLMARTALDHPDDPRLVICSFVYPQQMEKSGIVVLDITDAADLDIHDPTGRRIMARQFSEEPVGKEPRSRENAQVIDFARRSDPPTPRE